MTEEKTYDDNTMQIIKELRSSEINQYNSILKGVIFLMAWAFAIAAFFLLLLHRETTGAGAGIPTLLFFSCLVVVGPC